MILWDTILSAMRPTNLLRLPCVHHTKLQCIKIKLIPVLTGNHETNSKVQYSLYAHDV